MLRTMVCVPKAYSLLTMHSPPFSPRREAPSWRRKKFTWRPNYALLQLIQLNRIGSRRSCAWRSCAARRGGEGRHPGKKECFLRCDTVRAQVTRVMNRNWSLLLIIEMISELKENRWRGICYDLERHCLLLLRMESDTIFIVSRLLLRFQNSFSHLFLPPLLFSISLDKAQKSKQKFWGVSRESNENKYSRSLVYRFIERKSRDRRPTVQDVITHPESDLIPSPRPRRVPLPFRGQSALHKFSFEAGIACVHLRQDKCLPA